MKITFACQDIDTAAFAVLQERYRCPHFRILIIGRANAGKTTILEKVCGVAQGTKPIIYNQNGDRLNIMWHKLQSNLGQLLGRQSASSHLAPSMEVSQMVK
jgi:GTPase SAR1 family protein